MQFISKLSQKISTVLTFITSLMLFAATAIMVVLVITRYIFLYSFPWAEEVTRYLVVYLTLLASAVILRERDHIAVSYFQSKLPAVLRFILKLVFNLLILAAMVVWIVVGIDTANFMKTMWSGGVGITMFWPYMAIPISGAFCCFFVILNIIEDLTDRKRSGV